MKNMLKAELQRAFQSKMFWIAVAIGCVITGWHVVQNVIPAINVGSISISDKIQINYPNTVFNCWIGGEWVSLQPTLYYIIVPILAALPFADSFFVDQKSGYLKNVFTRCKKRDYFFSKYIAVFLSAGCAVVIPLLLNLLVTALLLPSTVPTACTGIFPMFSNQMWSVLFFTHPYWYIFFYLLLDFVFCGLWSTLSLIVAFYVNNRFVVLLVPFLLYVGAYFLLNFIGMDAMKVNPFFFLRPTQGDQQRFWPILIWMIGLLVVTLPLFVCKGTRDDVY